MTGLPKKNLAGAIALIGMSARFPGASSVAGFWENLRGGVESISRFDGDELRAAGVDEALLRDLNYVRAAGVLEGIEWFDAEFFGFRERDAETMDPQHRLFLECAWEAIEDAGYRTSPGGPTIGVFASTSISTYLLFNLAHRLDTSGADFNLATLIGNDKDYLATMTAYKLDLRGPTVSVQTACSSSLVAVHQACQALINGECDMALAGGVTVRVPHRVGYLHQGGSMLSPDGHCRAFDSRAGGTVPGSGVGVVVLKRLSDAVADRDCIRAVVLGSAINNDGAAKAGFTAPNVDGQASVIATAHAVAGINPRMIGYVEAHGTGTHLGDPIEIEALTKAFASTEERQFCAVGSVKTNIGHLESAAGIAGLIKTVLALQHKQIPPTLHFEHPNEQIDFRRSPVHVNVSLAEWKEPLPRCAAVSSFGFGGANCHVVLEEAPPPEATSHVPDRPVHLLVLSARSESALTDMSSRYVRFLNGESRSSIPDICYTANSGRQKFQWRKVAMGATAEELKQSLQSAPPLHAVNGPLIAFLFPGEGSQHAGMARELYETQPSFRETLQQCDELLRCEFGRSLLIPMLGQAPGQDWNQMQPSLPALFAMEYALAKLWRSWGVQPEVVLGHSLGEYAAACVAGIFGLEDGLRLVARCERWIKHRPARIAMATAQRSGAELEGPPGVVLGPEEMDVGDVLYSDPRIPIASNRTGAFIQPGEMAEPYWRMPSYHPMRFHEGLQAIVRVGCTVFMEIGPGAKLCELGLESCPQRDFTWLPSARAGREWRDMLMSLSAISGLGADIDWTAFDRDYPRRRVPLPTYPFQRKRYWVEAPAQACAPEPPREPVHPLLGNRLPLASKQLVFQARLSVDFPRFLADHQVKGAAVFPMTAYLEAALAAARQTFGKGFPSVGTLDIDAPLILRAKETCLIQVVVTLGPTAGEATFELFRGAANSSTWHRHATGVLRAEIPQISRSVSLERARDACKEEILVSDFYGTLREAGMEYGPLFRLVKRLWMGKGQALARVEAETDAAGNDGYILHPALADACLHAVGALIPMLSDNRSWLPVGLDTVLLHQPCPSAVWSHASVRHSSAGVISADICLFDDSGKMVAEFRGIRFQRGHTQFAPVPIVENLYEIIWRRLDPARPASARPVTGTWLVLVDGNGLGASAAKQLTLAGANCVLVYPGEDFERETPTRYRIRCHERADFNRLLAEATGGALTGAVHLWNLRTPGQDCPPANQQLGCGSALLLSQAVLDAKRRDGFRLWLVTSGTQRVDSADQAFAPMQALTWGLGRVLANEHPELGCVLVDVEARSPGAAARMLFEDFCIENPEEQLAYREGTRFTPRLVRRASERMLPDGPYRLPLPADGLLANLRCVPAEIPTPGPGEVGIRVRATSLNFRDVLNAVGLYPGVAPLGSDCAGEIYALGPGVSEFAIGQPVMAVAPGSFASHVTAPADFAVAKDTGIHFEEAAAVPTALLTAHHALFRVGGLQSGHKVLIHAGTGGVGLAAVRMALAAGAEVFATAGNPEKRGFLATLGVSLAMDSRSLDFSGEVLEATGGQGVDLVLNSLTGEFIPASFSTLRAGGRFLEIGKISIWDDARAAAEYPEVSYHRIGLDELMTSSRRELSLQLHEVLGNYFRDNRQHLPMRVFSMENASEAFRCMQGARHIGKIVVTHPREIRPDATYLIVGGLGALGLELVRAFAERGARSLALAGRRPPPARAIEVVEDVRSKGVRVEYKEADVTKPDDVTRLIASLGSAPPLRGIVHAAGVLDDCALISLDWDRFERAMAPKVVGAWNLHLASKDLPLDFFVLYSSAAAMLGPPGQASYAAANTFLDALSHYRHSVGLPCLCVNWGPWRVGMSAAAMDAREVSWSDLGLDQIESEQGHEALDRLLRAGVPQAAVIHADWPRFLDRFAGGRCPGLLRELGGLEKIGEISNRQADLRRELERLPADGQLAALRDRIRSLALQVLGRNPTQPLHDHLSLIEFGLDSLMTVELRNALGRLSGARLPSTLVFDYPTVDELSSYLAREVFHYIPEQARREPEGAREQAQQGTAIRLDDLSEGELAEWILRETDKWRREYDRPE